MSTTLPPLDPDTELSVRLALHTGLSPRQIEIIRAIGLGKTIKEIALDLSISDKTVAFHLTGDGIRDHGIRGKLGFHDPARLTHFAILHNLVTLGSPLP